jgi:hypothetical protein
VICCQFIFKPATYDDEFHRLDDQIDRYARSLPGFVKLETWQAPESDVVNAIYYFTDPKSVALLARFPQHREAKDHVALVRRLPDRDQRGHGNLRQRTPRLNDSPHTTGLRRPLISRSGKPVHEWRRSDTVTVAAQ